MGLPRTALFALGVSIDYALFILTRFRNGLDVKPRPTEGDPAPTGEHPVVASAD